MLLFGIQITLNRYMILQFETKITKIITFLQSYLVFTTSLTFIDIVDIIVYFFCSPVFDTAQDNNNISNFFKSILNSLYYAFLVSSSIE